MEQTLFGPILLEISEREILYYYSIFTCMCTYQDSQKNLSIINKTINDQIIYDYINNFQKNAAEWGLETKNQKISSNGPLADIMFIIVFSFQIDLLTFPTLSCLTYSSSL